MFEINIKKKLLKKNQLFKQRHKPKVNQKMDFEIYLR